jgi:hypothetical protein
MTMKNQGQTLSCIVRFKLQKNKKRGGDHLCWLVPVNRGEEVPGESEGEAGVPLLHPALQPQHHWEPKANRILKKLFSSLENTVLLESGG